MRGRRGRWLGALVAVILFLPTVGLMADRAYRSRAEEAAFDRITRERIELEARRLDPNGDFIQRCKTERHFRFYRSQVCYRLGLDSRDDHGAIAFDVMVHRPLSILTRFFMIEEGYFRATEHAARAGTISEDGSIRLTETQ